VIEVGEKFACICIQYWGRDLMSAVAETETITELSPLTWASSRAPFALNAHDRERMGHTVSGEIERSHLFLAVRHRASDPETQDLEMTALARRVMRLYVGLLFVTPGISLRSARLVDGVRLELGFRLFKDGHPYPLTYQAPGTPTSWGVAPAHLHHAVRIAQGLLATHGTGEFHRMGRVSAAMREALGARELATRLQQSIRALEGLILPQTAHGTAGIFSDRVKFFCGAQHVELLRDLYRMRGKIEHLHGPVAAVRDVRPDIVDDVEALVHFAFAAFIAENLARACVVRVYETPKLWPYFSTDAGLERFWSAPGQAQAWGEQIDLAHIIRSFDQETARRQLQDARREDSVGDQADVIDQEWLDAC
jgi:hypothetical protein